MGLLVNGIYVGMNQDLTGLFAVLCNVAVCSDFSSRGHAATLLTVGPSSVKEQEGKYVQYQRET